MRSRKLISIVALIGVLLHAGAIVRHHATMTGATIQLQSLLSDLTQICHGSGAGGVVAAADLPYLPTPTDAQNGCPICSGFAPAVALAAPQFEAVAVSQPTTVAFHAATHRVPDTSHAVCPPARGPPAAA